MIRIGNKEYNVKEATTPEDKAKGLSGVESLPEDEGMLFIFDPPEDVKFWMKDTLIPLDIIFINEDQEVVKVHQGIPNDETLIEVPNIAYVLEVNANSVLAQDGSEQYSLWGEERIFSRKNTKVLVRKAKKADQSKLDKDYKALGKYMFKCIKIQDNREPEYVDSPKKEEDSTSKS